MNISNLTPLRIYADVIATGSFTAAAALHGITQPAVSFHIRNLEDSMGVTLIAREGRRAIPTAAGVELLKQFAKVERATEELVREMTQFTESDATSLRIGTGSTACATLIPAALRLLRRSLPRTHLSIITGTTPEITRQLVANDLDIGIVTLPVQERSISTTRLLDDEIVLVAPISMNLPAEITPQSLEEHPAIMFQSAQVTRALIDGWFAQAGMSFRPTMTVGSLEALRALVGLEMGYAILSRLAIAPGALPDQLVVRSLSPQLHRTIGLAMRRDEPVSRAVEVFSAAIKVATA
ncbi:MAG: LysR family transcriptional regulator [Thermomicrobiales bacterium]|nr:LysR family transcriptional regulator [Thermomicrobiales bacterium]MCO5218605.1 LysR family transcriptional regulator [Thermomicrobiales bacterium]MCO5224282.1 LysR family transcriptional regulator [Thermomicrobiales bacterium]MCO5229013.1 LysR family transcriptional regulator [Thermomicrobiales bacterium]